MAVVSKETQEHPRNSQSEIASVPGITEEYITQVSEDFEGSVTIKLSHDFSGTKYRI